MKEGPVTNCALTDAASGVGAFLACTSNRSWQRQQRGGAYVGGNGSRARKWACRACERGMWTTLTPDRGPGVTPLRQETHSPIATWHRSWSPTSRWRNTNSSTWRKTGSLEQYSATCCCASKLIDREQVDPNSGCLFSEVRFCPHTHFQRVWILGYDITPRVQLARVQLQRKHYWMQFQRKHNWSKQLERLHNWRGFWGLYMFYMFICLNIRT